MSPTGQAVRSVLPSLYRWIQNGLDNAREARVPDKTTIDGLRRGRLGAWCGPRERASTFDIKFSPVCTLEVLGAIVGGPAHYESS
jgi:hypothetical protein